MLQRYLLPAIRAQHKARRFDVVGLHAGLRAPVCIGIHAVFAQGAYAKLQVCGAADVITCNTVFHTSNAIDVHPAIAERVRSLIT